MWGCSVNLRSWVVGTVQQAIEVKKEGLKKVLSSGSPGFIAALLFHFAQDSWIRIQRALREFVSLSGTGKLNQAEEGAEALASLPSDWRCHCSHRAKGKH